MKIAIIGTGSIGKMLGRKWAEAGHEVMFGSREAVRAQAVAAEIAGTMGGGVVEAAAFCEAALLAIPWYAFTDIERAIGEGLDGKIVIDCINPLKSSGSLAIGHKWSAGEEIARTWHRAKVVKAFNHIHVKTFENPVYDGKKATAFYCSNDDDAKTAIVQLAADLGLAPVDAGPIKNARLLEPLGALWMQLAFKLHHNTDLAFLLVDRE